MVFRSSITSSRLCRLCPDRVKSGTTADRGSPRPFVARKHRAGLRHDDLHPGNILIREDVDDEFELFLIDLHAVRLGKPLPWRRSLENLVILNRWFLIRCDRSDRRRAWRSYCEEREDLTLEERPLAREVEKATRKSFVAFARALTIAAWAAIVIFVK